MHSFATPRASSRARVTYAVRSDAAGPIFQRVSEPTPLGKDTFKAKSQRPKGSRRNQTIPGRNLISMQKI